MSLLGENLCDLIFNNTSYFIDALPDVALIRSRRGFQPQIIELGEEAVLARHPAIAKCFPVIFGTDRCRLLVERRQKLAHGAIERGWREISKFGDCVHEI